MMKNKKRKICAASVAGLLSVSAFASSWQFVTADIKGKYFLDFESKVKVGNFSKAWIRIDYFKQQDIPLKPKDKFVLDKALWYFDCPGRRIQMVATNSYDAAGQIVSSQNWTFNTADFSDVVPDTVGEAVHKSVCAPTSDLKAPKPGAKQEGALQRVMDLLSGHDR